MGESRHMRPIIGHQNRREEWDDSTKPIFESFYHFVIFAPFVLFCRFLSFLAPKNERIMLVQGLKWGA